MGVVICGERRRLFVERKATAKCSEQGAGDGVVQAAHGLDAQEIGKQNG